MPIFEVPKDQLANLSDADGRELVARLCEAELEQAGLPVSAVRWSGAQDAPDGGLDVDCCIEDRGFRGDFVPRARTGFQVKKQSRHAPAYDRHAVKHDKNTAD